MSATAAFVLMVCVAASMMLVLFAGIASFLWVSWLLVLDVMPWAGRS